MAPTTTRPHENVFCAHGDGNVAKRYPLVCLPAQGYGRREAAPLRVICFVPVCRHCRPKLQAADFLIEPTRTAIAEQVAALGKVAPDFDRAWLEFGTIGDNRWRHALGDEGGPRH